MQKNKRCSCCKEIKPVSCFYISAIQSSGLQSNCKDCNRIIARTYYRNVDKTKSKMSSRKTMLKSKYGMSIEEYNTLLASQNFVCAICGCVEITVSNKKGGVDSMVVDHNHTTNKVRGLLCHLCNRGLGNFKDSSELLIKASKYLEENK